MADSGLKPKVNDVPGGGKTLQASLEQIFRDKHLNIENCLPAKVISFDRVNNVATVQPLIKYVMVDDTTMSRNVLVAIPVLALGGGGFFVSFPLKEGDLGWIHATDRDIKLFLSSLTESAPPRGNLHKFEYGMFIPDVFRQYTVNSVDSTAMVISSTDGATRVSLRPGEIDITAPSAVNVTTPQATFSANVKINGNLIVEGNTQTVGTFEASGGFSSDTNKPCTLPTSTTIGGITVYGHGHIQNGTSGRTSNGMVQ